jgi:predicted Zn-dependent peptidase
LLSAPVAALKPDPKSADPEIPFEKYTLDNGLEVILIQEQSVPLVAVSVWYHVGSGVESPGKTGFAHLFEHMLFGGSKHVGADGFHQTLDGIGATGINGSTNRDRTNYFETVPSNQLEAALWLESDRMGYFLPTLDQKSLDNQIDVVRNERRERYDNVAYRRSLLALYETLYPTDHPYEYMTIGRHEDLEATRLDDVIAFYKTWYVPANATLAIAGDFDRDEARDLVSKWFGSFPNSVKPTVVEPPMPVIERTRKELVDEFARLRQVTFAWHSPGVTDPGDAELDILGMTLVGGESSRLYKKLVVEEQLAQSVGGGQTNNQFSSYFEITVTLRGEADLAAVEALVEAEVAEVRDEAISERELTRAITRYEARAIRGLEGLLPRAERLQAFNHYYGDPDSFSRDLDRYRAVTVDAIRAEAARHLVPERQVTLVTMPGGAK